MSREIKAKASNLSHTPSKGERRVTLTSDIEVRNAHDSPKGEYAFRGYAAKFNRMSGDLGGFKEVINPGAFRNAIKEGDDVRALFNHDSNFVLGRTRSGTLRLQEDATGLLVEFDAPDTELTRSIAASVARGDIDQMSFGFTTVDDDWSHRNGEVIRELNEARLFDVSIVTYPAYEDTEIALRSMEEHLGKETREEGGKVEAREESAAEDSGDGEVPGVSLEELATKLADLEGVVSTLSRTVTQTAAEQELADEEN